MLLKLLYFLPALVSANWSFLFFSKKRSWRQNLLLNCMILMVLYFISYAFFCMPDTNMHLFCIMERIGLPSVFLVVGMIAIYLNTFMDWEFPRPLHLLLLVPGIIYGVMLNLLYYIIGGGDAEKFIYLIDRHAALPQEYQNRLFDTFGFVDVDLVVYIGVCFIMILMAECIYLLYKGKYHVTNIARFLFLGRQASPTGIIAFFIIFFLCLLVPVTVLGPEYMQDHQTFSFCVMVCIAVTIHVFCTVEYHSDIEDFTLRNILNPKGYYELKTKEREETEMLRKMLENQEEERQELSYKERRKTELLMEFKRVMEEETMFLDSDISIINVAAELNVGRTTLSGIINQAYGKNFRGVVNDYRIEYAKKYILEHPLLTQEKMAFACGFKDASAFSHKFRERVGMSPLAWMKDNS